MEIFTPNKAKMDIGVSDQMSSYSKYMMWFQKVFEEIILGTAIVKSWLAYRYTVGTTQPQKQNLSITTLNEKLAFNFFYGITRRCS